MKIRDRVKEFRRVRASELFPNPKNWRIHSDGQREAFRGLVEEVGFAGAELCYYSQRNGGKLTVIDGHMRQQEVGDAELPCIITDLDDEEADKLLLAFDPIGGMADADVRKLDALMRDVQTSSGPFADLLTSLGEEHGILPEGNGQTVLKQLDTRPPPKMTWVLLGIPTVRFGEIAGDVERLSAIDGIILESTSNDG